MDKKKKRNSRKNVFPPGSMVDKSIRIGYDVRDLIMMGYTDEDIRRAADGEITLNELFEKGPSEKQPSVVERLFEQLLHLLTGHNSPPNSSQD